MCSTRGIKPDIETVEAYRRAAEAHGEVKVRELTGLSRSSILRIAAGLNVGVPILTHAQLKAGTLASLGTEAA